MGSSVDPKAAIILRAATSATNFAGFLSVELGRTGGHCERGKERKGGP